jgi:DNA-binding NarL/FixJ family response regulator
VRDPEVRRRTSGSSVPERGVSVAPVRVLLADDHTLVRAGFHTLLSSLPEVEVVADAQDGREVLGLVAEFRPDVVLLDISMPYLDGLEVTEQLAAEFPEVHVIILSMHADAEYVWRALDRGADGYLLKSADLGKLQEAFATVMAGRTYLSPGLSERAVEGYVDRAAGDADVLTSLTPRQREVLRLIAAGHATQEIARELEIAVKTVEAHSTELRRRLGIYDVAGLVRYAVRAGLVRLEE